MFKWLTNRFSKKEFTYATPEQVWVRNGDAYFFDRSYFAMSREGYQNNIIANHCINKIAMACADVPIEISVNGTEIDDENATNDRVTNAIVKLFSKPNTRQNYKTFMFDAIAYRLIDGNTYFHLIRGDVFNTPMAIELFRPDRVYIDVVNNIPMAYRYTPPTGQQFTYQIDQITGECDVLQCKTFNPLSDLYGMSPIAAAMMAIGQHNEASRWNKALLQNSSKPAGILSMKDRNDNAANLTEQQIQSISRQINSKWEGATNAGRILTLNHDMQFQQLQFSPTDMDWLNGKNANARDICLAFGYPSFLLGLPDATSTFNNVEQAKLSLYEETVLPTLCNVLECLGNWLSEMTGIDIELEPDLDQVSALSPRRQVARENARLDLAAGIITTNEAREEIGYEDVPGGDEIMVPAGKLPLNFDLTGLDAQKFTQYLIESKMPPDAVERLVKLAYPDASR